MKIPAKTWEIRQVSPTLIQIYLVVGSTKYRTGSLVSNPDWVAPGWKYFSTLPHDSPSRKPHPTPLAAAQAKKLPRAIIDQIRSL